MLTDIFYRETYFITDIDKKFGSLNIAPDNTAHVPIAGTCSQSLYLLNESSSSKISVCRPGYEWLNGNCTACMSRFFKVIMNGIKNKFRK